MKEMRILQALDGVEDRFVKELYEQKATCKQCTENPVKQKCQTAFFRCRLNDQ